MSTDVEQRDSGPRPGKIYQAIIDIMAEIGPIAKESRNTQQGYNYRGIDTVYNKLQPLLIKHGVFSTPGKILSMTRETRTTNKGGSMAVTVSTIRYDIYAADGSSIPCEVIGEGQDSGDKASNKAMSVAHKYAWFQILCIPIASVDPDGHSEPVDNPEAKRGAPKVPPRDQRGDDSNPDAGEFKPEVLRDELLRLVDEWKKQHGTGKQAEDQKLFVAWARDTAGVDDPEFKPLNSDTWYRDDILKCWAALGVPV